ncbi:MAG TPA: hypothetical protein VLT45_26935 [Kofleriaceae bacterium]|nr:hypothetical protein [Kofleriaceae bacterium]
MRAEDKEVDGRELEDDIERQRESELEKSDDEDLPELQSEANQETEHRGQVVALVRAILNREHVVVDTQQLPQRELKALEALQAAVEGRDAKLAQFVYASDRRDLLEQALAVLQPNFVSGDEKHAQVLGDYHDVIEQVAALREGLVDKEDAQDDLLRGNPHVAPTKAEGDQDDEAPGEPKPGESKPGESTLTGPERKEPPKPASTLAGPEVKEPPKPASTLTGPEVKEPPKPASTLAGPEVKDEPKGPSTLGDEKDLAEAQKQPWWQRVLG